jgi:murein L,D-transpeptidase YafK
LFQIRIKSMMNDLMILFSDFKERLTEGYFFENQQRMDPKTLRYQRDKYLAIY